MNQTLTRKIEFFAALIYAVILRILKKNNQRIVIYYHGLPHKDIKQFEKQMAYLAEKCLVVRASEIKTMQPNTSKTIVGVTFDDALESFYNNVLPILERYKLTASVFVPSGNLGRRQSWEVEGDSGNAGEVVMNERQLAGLDKSGYEILSHSVSHPFLTDIDDERLQNELSKSKRDLERIVNHEVWAISYPYGEYDERVCRATRQAGYKMGFTIEPYTVDSSPDNYQIGRFAVSPADSLLKFRLRINGAYQIAKYLRKLKRMLLRSSRTRRNNCGG